MNPRTVLITGASSGIGEAFAEVFAAEGFDLVITARREDRLGTVAERLRRRYARRVEVITADLSEQDAPAGLCDEIARRGLAIDVLVNNAGYGIPGTFTASAWARHAALLQVMVGTVRVRGPSGQHWLVGSRSDPTLSSSFPSRSRMK